MGPMPVDGTAMDHVRHLAGSIGPRGTGTAGERAAAEHAGRHLADLGLDVHVEPFSAPVSGWRGFAIAAATALLASAAFVSGGRFGAAVGGVVLTVATVSVFLEMYFRPNPLRALVARVESRNVWASVRPVEPPAARVVLVAHLDTHRTPWAFRSPARLTLFRVATAVGIVAFVLGAALFLAGTLVDLGPWRWTVATLAPVYALVLALTWPTDRTPYTAGANDNASGVGVVLSLARRLASAPLARTEVSLLLSGAEEVGSYGAQAFVARHRRELADALVVSIDNVGGRGTGPCFTTVEGMVWPLRPDGGLLAHARGLAAERTDLGAYERPYTTLHTDATCFMAAGVRSLSFVGLTPAGVIPDWHTVHDVVERVDPDAVARVEAFVWALLHRIDAAA